MSDIVPVIVISFLLVANVLVLIFSVKTFDRCNQMIAYLVKIFDAVQKGVKL